MIFLHTERVIWHHQVKEIESLPWAFWFCRGSKLAVAIHFRRHFAFVPRGSPRHAGCSHQHPGPGPHLPTSCVLFTNGSVLKCYLGRSLLVVFVHWNVLFCRNSYFVVGWKQGSPLSKHRERMRYFSPEVEEGNLVSHSGHLAFV